MKQYTIYCTEEQTLKSKDLGAPLDTFGFAREPIIPTAEEMLNWLEEQGFGFDIARDNEGYEYSVWIRNKQAIHLMRMCDSEEYYETREKATLSAIGVALDYLTKNK